MGKLEGVEGLEIEGVGDIVREPIIDPGRGRERFGVVGRCAPPFEFIETDKGLGAETIGAPTRLCWVNVKEKIA